MKKFIKFLSLLSIVAMLGGMITSCRGNSAKKAVDIVKKYSGKVFKNSEIEIIKSGKRKERYDSEVSMKELKALEEGFKMDD